jgi:hypothetical protein
MADNSKLRPFPDRILDIGEVRSHFSSAPCCNNNCMEKIFCMPVDPLVVPLASTVQRINKESVSTSSSSTSDDGYGAKLRTYEALLKAVRWQLMPFRRDDGNTHAVSDFLTEHFTEKQNPNSGRWLYDLTVAGKNYEVCRTAWMGVMGVTANELEYAQMKVRTGATSTVRVDPKDAIKSKKAVFREFGLDVDDYHRYLRGMVDYNEVPDNARSHIAVAFLIDFVDNCGEYQPDEEAWHLDSMDVKEIWREYQKDETVLRLTNLDRGMTEVLPQDQLTTLWKRAFPKVHIREWKGITGRYM